MQHAPPRLVAIVVACSVAAATRAVAAKIRSEPRTTCAATIVGVSAYLDDRPAALAAFSSTLATRRREIRRPRIFEDHGQIIHGRRARLQVIVGKSRHPISSAHKHAIRPVPRTRSPRPSPARGSRPSSRRRIRLAWKSTSVSGPRNSSLSHFAAMALPCSAPSAVRNGTATPSSRHASMAWRISSARDILISTQKATALARPATDPAAAPCGRSSRRGPCSRLHLMTRLS